MVFPALAKAQNNYTPGKSKAFPDTDVHFWHLELHPNMQNGYLSAYAETWFFALQSADSLCFDLHDSLMVDSATWNGTSVSFSQAGNGSLCLFPQNRLMADSHYVSGVWYHGHPPQGTGLGGYTQTLVKGKPEVWTLSQPFFAHTWWPVEDALGDKADSLRLVLKPEAPFRSAAPGQFSKLQDGSEVWMHRFPIPAYLVAFSIAEYLSLEENWIHPCGPTVEFVQLVYPDKIAEVIDDTKHLRQSMEFLCNLLEPYPYFPEKYGHAQFSRGGGMEHPTMSFMGSFGFELTLHELAHHWFGNMVTCGSWTDIWLNEGFATYLSGMGFEAYYPADWTTWKQKKQQSVWELPTGALYVEDSLNTSRIFSSRLSYNKAAMVLHQLRWWIGNQAFQTGMRNYLLDPKLRWGFASTADLKHHMEQASGVPLTDFFQAWVYGDGFPELQTSWKRKGLHGLEWHIQQKPSSPIGPKVFPLPIRIAVRGLEQDTTIDLQLTGVDSIFSLSFPFVVVGWEPDPENDMLAHWSSLDFVEEHPINAPRLVPNPGQQPLFWLPQHLENLNQYQVQLRDMQGRTIGQQESVKHAQPIPVREHLRPGPYLVEVWRNQTLEFVLQWIKL